MSNINTNSFLDNCFDIETTSNVEINNDENSNHIPEAFQIRKKLTNGFEILDTIYTKRWGNDPDTTQRKTQEKAWMLTGINKGFTLVVVKMYHKSLRIKDIECWNSNKAA